jgi:hypothetical protein
MISQRKELLGMGRMCTAKRGKDVMDIKVTSG